MWSLKSIVLLYCIGFCHGIFTNDFLSLPGFARSAFSGAGIPPEMAYQMFDGSISDFAKYKALNGLTGGKASSQATAGILNGPSKGMSLGGTNGLMASSMNSLRSTGSKSSTQMLYLCSETPSIYKLQQCSAVRKCMHPLTVCVQTSLFTGCCAKNFASLRVID